jgi:regulator of sigma E protease
LNLSWQHLLAFIVAVGVLVTVHEFGHYWVARRLGFKVLRFSVGFGKSLVSRVAGRDQTEYVIAAIPLGGYVKLLDEREGPVDPAEAHRAFNRKPHWQRVLVLLAGPAFNIAFAILLLAAMFWVNGATDLRAVVGEVRADSPAALAGMRRGDEIVSLGGHQVTGQSDVVLGLLERMTDDGAVQMQLRTPEGVQRELRIRVADAAERRRLTEPERLLRGVGFEFWQPAVPARVGSIEAGGPAAVAGMVAGDLVLAVDGVPVGSFSELRTRIESRPGESVVLDVRRGTSELTLRVAVAAADASGRHVGRLGIASAASAPYPPEMLRHTSLGAGAALVRGGAEAWKMTALQGQVFWRMLLGKVSLKNLSGPLTIAEYAGDSARSGPAAFIGFLVLISLSLGFLNLLPIPILDGGQVVYQLLEWAKGAPLSERFQAFGQQVGIGLLMLMMGVALFNDIVRQFG